MKHTLNWGNKLLNTYNEIQSGLINKTDYYSLDTILKNKHTYIHSLSTLLGTLRYYEVGPPFAFRTALILHGIDSTRCWKHSSEILVHINMIASHSCCRFVTCTSMIRIFRSSTSQRRSIGLRSGDCGGHLSKVDSLCSINQSEMIWALWIILLEVAIRRWVHCSHKGMDMLGNNTQVGCGV